MEYDLTPSAALADYVFPASSTVEQPELWLTRDFCMPCPQGIEPLYERRNSYDFYRDLGIRLGQEAHWPWEMVEQVYDYCLAPIGLTFQAFCDQYGIFGEREFRLYEKYGFDTPSGKVELKSSIFIEKARKKHPDPIVTIHPSTAEKSGLAAGDWAVISTPTGKIRQKVGISDSIREDMVDLQHGWWFPESEEKLPNLFRVFESNANLLCPDDPDVCSPEIGSWPHSALLCRVEKETERT